MVYLRVSTVPCVYSNSELLGVVTLFLSTAWPVGWAWEVLLRSDWLLVSEDESDWLSFGQSGGSSVLWSGTSQTAQHAHGPSQMHVPWEHSSILFLFSQFFTPFFTIFSLFTPIGHITLLFFNPKIDSHNYRGPCMSSRHDIQLKWSLRFIRY